jgi:hypothetical protein
MSEESTSEGPARPATGPSPTGAAPWIPSAVRERSPTLLTANGTLLTAPSCPRKRSVAVNHDGHVIGEGHHRAVRADGTKVTDHEIELMWALRAGGLSYAAIADKMEMSRGGVGKILRGERRGQPAIDQKLLPPPAPRAPRRRPARPSEFEVLAPLAEQ